MYSRGQGLVNNPLIDSRINSMNYMNLFNRNIYSGLDKISKTNKIILGLEYFFFSSSSSISSSFSFGQAFFLKDQEDFYNTDEEVSKSPLVAELRSDLSKNIKYSSLFEWDHNTNKLNSGSVGLIIKDNKKRFEFRSVYRRKNFHQVYIPWKDDVLATYQIESLGTWPISNSWSIFGRWQKDLKTYKSLDILFGFQYENCCLKVGIMNRRWIDEDYFSWKENYEDPIRAILEGFEPDLSNQYVQIVVDKHQGRFEAAETKRKIEAAKDDYNYLRYKFVLFVFGVITIVISEISIKYSGDQPIQNLFLISLPILLFIFIYSYFIKKLKIPKLVTK